MIKVSVVIPVYNNPDGLNKVLVSLVGQDFPKKGYEIIVADNHSTDESLNVAKEYSENYPNLVKYLSEDKIQSSYAARNKGIHLAEGDIIAFTDSDCIPVEYWLTEGYKSLKQNNAAMVAGRIEFTYKNSKPNIWEYYDSASTLKQKSYVENAGFGATANLFVLKKMFNEYGYFLSELQSGGDYEFGRRLTQSGEVLIYDQNTLVYHPARSRFREKLNKTKRIIKGQKTLTKMGYLKHGKVSFKQLVPTRHYPFLKGQTLNYVEKLLLILINNYFRYYDFFKRVAVQLKNKYE